MVSDHTGDIAVVVAVRDGLPHVIEAVTSALEQGATLREVIVVDDGSRDGTFERLTDLSSPRLRVVRNPDRGVSSARNAGAASTEAPWLLFLDADDRLTPNAFVTLLAAARSSEPAAVYGDYERIDGDSRVIGKRKLMRTWRKKPSGAVLDALAGGNFIINGGVVLCSRAAFLDVGGFEQSLALCEDWHLWCRLAAFGPIEYVASHVLDYRVHPSSVMMASRRRYSDFKPALDAVFQDRLITDRLDPRRVPGFRRRAEQSLLTYCAQQAVRAGSFREGAALAITALKRAPERTPWVLGRMAGALVSL